LEEKIKIMASEILDMAVDGTLDFCLDKVMGEDDNDILLDASVDNTSNEMVSSLVDNLTAVITESQLSDPMAMANAEAKKVGMSAMVASGAELSDAMMVAPIVAVAFGGMVDVMAASGIAIVGSSANLVADGDMHGSAEWSGCLHGRVGRGHRPGRHSAVSAPPATRSSGPIPPLPDILEAAAGIREVLLPPTRSIPRLTGVADCHVMERAKQRTAWKNLDHGGTFSASCPPLYHVIVSKVNNLGVDMGSNDIQICESVSLLNIVENPNSISQISMDSSNMDCDQFKNDEEENYDFENHTLGHLCGELVEEVMDEDNDHLSCDFHTVFKKNKSENSSRKKGNAKIRVIKKHKGGDK
jgi:hypothetical protein